ncbi:MAG: hypothetical protein UT65_C0014G0002 [Parcubacteria group bacterium GW2011_GWF2_39_8b]|nr:MAG: hypothetical protein UT65_C0014G0002 [Parcubacteria group bacterium GW2011_GWF2_39_8b]
MLSLRSCQRERMIFYDKMIFMLSNNKILILIITILIFTVIFGFIYGNKTQSQIILNGKIFQAEVVRSQSELGRGLSGHKGLSDNEGMLFIFDKPDNYGFWMKDMRFPIDIIWLDQNFKVVHVEKSVATSTYPKVFYPSGPATYVLEVNSGISDSINLQIGDEAKFIKK